jgi:hypothetical protein
MEGVEQLQDEMIRRLPENPREKRKKGHVDYAALSSPTPP